MRSKNQEKSKNSWKFQKTLNGLKLYKNLVTTNSRTKIKISMQLMIVNDEFNNLVVDDSSPSGDTWEARNQSKALDLTREASRL